MNQDLLLKARKEKIKSMKLNIAAARESSAEKTAALNVLSSARSNKQSSQPAMSARMSYNSVALASHRQKSNDLIA